MTLLHTCSRSIVVALAVAALAVPMAQAGSIRPELAAQTEAKGYAALSQAILNTSRLQSQNPAAQTEAKGYAVLSQAILNTSRLQSQNPAAQTEAKGYAALSEAVLNTSRRQSQSEVATTSGFDWGDAGIGAAATLGFMLFVGGLGVGVAVHGRSRQPKHA